MSEQQTEVSTLGQLPSRINEHHRLAQEHAASAVLHAQQAGDLLLEAKRTIGHGHWRAWLAEHVQFSARTAQGYMRVARDWPKAQRVADLSLRRVLAALADRGPAGDATITAEDRQFLQTGERLRLELLGLKADADAKLGSPELTIADCAALREAAGDLSIRLAEHRTRAERRLGELLRAAA